MKKFLIIVPLACLIFSSCVTNETIKTASTKEVDLTVTADLEIAQTKIRYKYVYYSNDYNLDIAKENAISEALRMHGDADVIVSPQYEIKDLDIETEIIVSGYPAKYKNLRSVSVDGTIFRTTKNKLTEDQPKVPTSIQNSTKEGLESQPSIQEQYNLGISYLNTNNFNEAEKHLKQAAELGHKEAQYELGSLYLREEFIGKAKKWLKKAADQGHKDANDLLKNLQ